MIHVPDPHILEIFPKHWQTCDGNQLRRLFQAALISLENNYEHVNQLNVFPIPDGDTGINMLLTVRKAFSAIENGRIAHVGQVANQFARGALMEARGNSGVILSQIFRGLAASLRDVEAFNAFELAEGLQTAVEKAYSSVSDPVEGTILTVLRETAVSAHKTAQTSGDLRFVLEQMLLHSKQALAHTPEQLPILKKAGVVDSGGQGFVYLLQGMVDLLDGKITAIDTVTPKSGNALPAQAFAIPESGQIENPYDVQFLLYGEGLDLETVRQDIDAMGDSTVVVGDASLIKVHVHVKNPGEPLSYASALGQIHDVVVENMQFQMEAIVGESSTVEQTAVSTNPPISSDQISVVAVAAGDGLASIFKSLRAAQIVSGGQTNNPSVEDILQAIEHAPSNSVIVLPNNKNIILAAESARDLSPKSVIVLPTKTTPEGMAAMMALNLDGDLEQTAVSMQAMADEMLTGEITIATRTVELDGIVAQEGAFIGLANGRLCASALELTAVFDQLLQAIDINDHELVSLYYGQDISQAEATAIQTHLEEAYPAIEFELLDGGQPHYHYILGVE